MSEQKSIYDGGTIGLPGSGIQVSDNVARWTGNPIYHENGSGCEKFIPLNGEPLSTKQLHEVIVSQAMTIDRLLGEVAKRDDDIKVLEYANNKLLDIVIELKEKLK